MAFARFQKIFPASEYWFIGDGSERNWLEQLALQLGIGEKVTFLGQLPHNKVLDKLAECDVFVHPALHDSAPAVCLEAMATGRPVICLDLGGPALQVTEETGIKVPAILPEQVERDLASAMERLANDPNLRKRMGESARQRVRENFYWDRKGDFINELYRGVLRYGKGS
jgi:glycosyltransferase involved in cell wall biosynthesis